MIHLFSLLCPAVSLSLLQTDVWVSLALLCTCACVVSRSVRPDSLRSYGLQPGRFFSLGIFLARVLEWVAISSCRRSPDPGVQLTSPALADGFFTTELHKLLFSIIYYGDIQTSTHNEIFFISMQLNSKFPYISLPSECGTRTLKLSTQIITACLFLYEY